MMMIMMMMMMIMMMMVMMMVMMMMICPLRPAVARMLRCCGRAALWDTPRWRGEASSSSGGALSPSLLTLGCPLVGS